MGDGLLLLARYFTIAVVIAGLVFSVPASIESATVILTLLFIINTQLRYFAWRNKPGRVFLSLAADCLVGVALVSRFPLLLLPFFLLIVVDALLLAEGKSRYLSLGLAVIALAVPGSALTLQLRFVYGAALVMIILITAYARQIKDRQIQGEDLYHELRKSQDELIKANKDLELYADSVRDLTLLQERTRISREIHDSVGHSLSTIIVQLGAIEKIAEESPPLAAAMAGELRDFSKSGLEEVRKALQELKPKEFEDYKTLSIIQSLTANFSKLTGIEIKLGFSKARWQLDEEASLVIYRAVQEFLSNSARHGRATKINIFVHIDEQAVIVTMRDNGAGTDKIQPGLGLSGLTERVSELGGQIRLESSPGQGFLLRMTFPPRRISFLADDFQGGKTFAAD